MFHLKSRSGNFLYKQYNLFKNKMDQASFFNIEYYGET